MVYYGNGSRLLASRCMGNHDLSAIMTVSKMTTWWYGCESVVRRRYRGLGDSPQSCALHFWPCLAQVRQLHLPTPSQQPALNQHKRMGGILSTVTRLIMASGFSGFFQRSSSELAIAFPFFLAVVQKSVDGIPTPNHHPVNVLGTQCVDLPVPVDVR